MTPARWKSSRRQPSCSSGIDVELVLTHFACADEPGHPMNAEQLRVVRRAAQPVAEAPASIGNSAATLIDAQHRGDVGAARHRAVRRASFPRVFANGESDGAVATLRARSSRFAKCEHADRRLRRDLCRQPPARLAIVGAGYADGYPRALGNRGAAALAGRRVPVVGRVSMDLLCVDVLERAGGVAHVGALVELIGPTVTVDEVAEPPARSATRSSPASARGCAASIRGE